MNKSILKKRGTTHLLDPQLKEKWSINNTNYKKFSGMVKIIYDDIHIITVL